jgi:MGT family glycosyltransferase
MSRAWFYNIPYHGHINPTLPLVQELVNQGDQVTYYSTPEFSDRISATGADFRAYETPTAFKSTRTINHTTHVGGLVAEAAHALLPEVLSAVEQERPDYLIFDMSAPWGGIAGRRFHIPSIASFPHFPFIWRAAVNDQRVFRKMANSIRPGYGYTRRLARLTMKIVKDFKLRKVQDINVISSSAGLNIVFTSRYFQPYEEQFDETYHYIGPVIDFDRQEEPFDITRQEGQKLIYIAVGTVYEANLQFFRTCFQALAGDKYAVILSVGRSIDPSTLEPLPDNFTVAQYVPQLSILQEADLFITHGGMNSISESIFYTVPMIVVPNTLEQAINAARIEQLSAGLYFDSSRLTIETLRTSTDSAIKDSSLIRGLERIKTSFLQAGGVPRAAEQIQAFKQSHGISNTSPTK